MKDIIYEEILKELFDTWDEDSYKWLQRFAASRQRRGLYRKLKKYQETHPQAGRYTGNTSQDVIDTATERNKKKLNRITPNRYINYARKLNRYSIPRDKENWGNAGIIGDRYDYDNLDSSYQDRYDNELKMKKFFNTKGQLKDYDEDKMNQYMRAARRYGSLKSNLKSLFNPKERQQRKKDYMTMDRLKDDVYFGDPTTSFSDRYNSSLAKGMRKVQRFFKGDSRKDRNKETALKIYLGEIQPTKSQKEIIMTHRFHQPENPRDFAINKCLFDIVKNK